MNLDWPKLTPPFVCYRCVVLERSGAPTAASQESEHGTGDPEEPAAREPAAEQFRAERRHVGAPVEEPGKGWRALVPGARCAAQDHATPLQHVAPRPRSSFRAHAHGLRDRSSARESRRREHARPQLHRRQ